MKGRATSEEDSSWLGFDSRGAHDTLFAIRCFFAWMKELFFFFKLAVKYVEVHDMSLELCLRDFCSVSDCRCQLTYLLDITQAHLLNCHGAELYSARRWIYVGHWP